MIFYTKKNGWWCFENIAPTSIASEQTFSIATDFIPKKRSKLSDKAIDDLIFEKGYFQNENWKYL